MPLRITFYDGADCIGGNKFMLEADGTALFFDFGTNFGGEATFFDEFLRPRSATGLCDLLELGLLPPLRGIYRRDFEPRGRQTWEQMASRPLYRELEVQAVLLSHAHVDHSGYISFLDPGIPVVTGLSTAVIAKAMQDTAPGGMERETCYVTPREEKEGLLHAAHYKKAPHEQRPYVVLDGCMPSPEAEEFWNRPGTSRTMNSRPLAVHRSGEFEVGGLLIRRWPVDHSIPGAGAFGVRTSEGWIVYTGDLRLHGWRGQDTRRFMEEVGRLEPVALICEGTHPGTATPVTEQEVCSRAVDAVRKAEGLVIADFGPRNVERLLTFLRAAGEAGRLLAVTAKDAYLLEALHAAGEPEVPDPLTDHRIALYVEAKSVRQAWERVLMERYLDRCPERVISAKAVRCNPGGYVLCFSYYDLSELIDIQVRGGTSIYSSSEAYNEEMQIDLDRLRSWVRHFGLRFVGDPGDREGRGRDPGFHASGHIHGPGLVELVETVKPRVLLPVHSEDRSFFEKYPAGATRLVLPRLGEAVELSEVVG